MEGTYTGSVRCNVRCSEFIVYKDQGWGGKGGQTGLQRGQGVVEVSSLVGVGQVVGVGMGQVVLTICI